MDKNVAVVSKSALRVKIHVLDIVGYKGHSDEDQGQKSRYTENVESSQWFLDAFFPSKHGKMKV